MFPYIAAGLNHSRPSKPAAGIDWQHVMPRLNRHLGRLVRFDRSDVAAVEQHTEFATSKWMETPCREWSPIPGGSGAPTRSAPRSALSESGGPSPSDPTLQTVGSTAALPTGVRRETTDPQPECDDCRLIQNDPGPIGRAGVVSLAAHAEKWRDLSRASPVGTRWGLGENPCAALKSGRRVTASPRVWDQPQNRQELGREAAAPKGGRNAHRRERFSSAQARPRRRVPLVGDNSPAPEATGLSSWPPSSRTRSGALHPRRRD